MKTKEMEYLDTIIDLRDQEIAARKDNEKLKISSMFVCEDIHIITGIEQIALQAGSKLRLTNNRSEYYFYRVSMTYRGMTLYTICDDYELNKFLLLKLIDEDQLTAVREEVAEYQKERAIVAVSKMAIAN